MRGGARLLAVLALTAPLAGCIATDAGSTGRFAVDTNGCIDASGVDNQPGSFDYGGAVSCKTATEEYEWANPSYQAGIEWGGSHSSGSVTVTISDGLGNQVYQFTVDGTSSEGERGLTAPGAPGPAPPLTGPWTVRVDFNDFTGAMGLAVRST